MSDHHTDRCTMDCSFSYEFDCDTHGDYCPKNDDKKITLLCGHFSCCDGEQKYCDKFFKGYCSVKCMDENTFAKTHHLLCDMKSLLKQTQDTQHQVLREVQKLVSLLSGMVPKKED